MFTHHVPCHTTNKCRLGTVCSKHKQVTKHVHFTSPSITINLTCFDHSPLLPTSATSTQISYPSNMIWVFHDDMERGGDEAKCITSTSSNSRMILSQWESVFWVLGEVSKQTFTNSNDSRPMETLTQTHIRSTSWYDNGCGFPTPSSNQDSAPEASLLCTMEGFLGGRSSGVGMPSPMDSCNSIFSCGGNGFLGLLMAALAML